MVFKTMNNPTTALKKSIGVSLSLYYVASYEELQEVLGDPLPKSDEYKVSTEWILEDENGNVATVYDYKSTSLYAPDLPSVEEFRKLKKYKWHIGTESKETAVDLAKYLSKKLGGKKMEQFKKVWEERYRTYIHYDPTDKEIERFLDDSLGDVDAAINYVVDWILSRGLADVTP